MAPTLSQQIQQLRAVAGAIGWSAVAKMIIGELRRRLSRGVSTSVSFAVSCVTPTVSAIRSFHNVSFRTEVPTTVGGR
jgi:hypothetical protein